uniref:RING-CH-type domain-containing protein n=1 Tax=Steinernema glaseri TaxID=37863 RepID=A0A1I7Y1S3_9BILA
MKKWINGSVGQWGPFYRRRFATLTVPATSPRDRLRTVSSGESETRLDRRAISLFATVDMTPVGPRQTKLRETPPQNSFDSTQLSLTWPSSTPIDSSFRTAPGRLFTELDNSEVDISLSEASDALDTTQYSGTRSYVEIHMPQERRISETILLNKGQGEQTGIKNDIEPDEKERGVRFANPIAIVRSQTSFSSMNSDRRACRICQSETGDMVRPCACTGTMGDIHENCLNMWLQRSNRGNTCEICKQEYSKSGKVFKPLLQWSKPKVKENHLVELIAASGLMFSIYYLWTLMLERGFHERIFFKRGVMRSPDLARLIILLLVTCFMLKFVCITVSRFMHYLRKQQTVHFVDSSGHQHPTSQ